jgi:hypothetical protein
MKDPNILACVSLPSLQRHLFAAVIIETISNPTSTCISGWNTPKIFFHWHEEVMNWIVLILEIQYNKMFLYNLDNGRR